MKSLIFGVLSSLLTINAWGFEVFALGTSNTNCKNAGQAYTRRLNELLVAEKISAEVINAGLNGDRPQWMMNRLEAGLKTYPNIKLVIFEPGPNEKFKPANLEASGNILAHLQENKIPTIYVSNTSIQSDDEAEGFAKKYGAYYYGRWKKNIPRDNTHNQFDEGTSGGHLTVKGCELWAENMLPLVLQVMKEKNIR